MNDNDSPLFQVVMAIGQVIAAIGSLLMTVGALIILVPICYFLFLILKAVW
jgi:hypothetical protein